MIPWRPITVISPLLARVMVRVECGCGSVRGDRVFLRRDQKERMRVYYRCAACVPEGEKA